MNLNELNHLVSQTGSTPVMPVLFFGHGSPMNAIEQNPFSQTWRELGKSLPRPSAILCISAHWETKGTFVTAVERPRTIHDFYGFPDSLFAVQYPAPGDPKLADALCGEAGRDRVGADTTWGLDHGCWSVLKHLYPGADIPVVQLSLDHTLNPAGHLVLARELSDLRRKGVLVIGSGNIVHNLRMIDWKHANQGYDWAIEAKETIKKLALKGDTASLAGYPSLGKALQNAIPTPEHFLPLLYVMALREERDQAGFFNDACVYGSIAMTSVKIFQ